MRQGSYVLTILFVCLIVACTGSTADRHEAASQIGEALGEGLDEPLQVMAESGSSDNPIPSDELNEVVEEQVNDLEYPSGVSRLELGRSVSWGTEPGAAWVSTAVVVVPSDDADDLYCVVVAIHSDGRVRSELSGADPMDRCADARLIDFHLS